MGKIRTIIRNLTPLGLILQRTQNRFMDEMYKWKNTDKDFPWDEESKFRHIVSVDGFGASGASAVLDLFREYDGNTILGTVDYCGSLASPKDSVGEIDFIRYTGGLLQMLQCFDEVTPKSQFWDDAMMKLFLDNVYYSELYRKFPVVRPCFYKFVDNIIDIHTRDINGHLYNVTLGKLENESEIFTLKRLRRDEYILLCRRFIFTLFNRFHHNGIQGILLDQLFADCGHNMQLFREFIPNLKRIVVYRDPRDVYCIALKLNLKWMPHDSVENYINWVSLSYDNFDRNATDYMPVRFEDMIFDYDATVCKIEQYLSVDSSLHTRPLSCFNPAVSNVSVREWTRKPEYNADFEKIKQAFPELCYR